MYLSTVLEKLAKFFRGYFFGAPGTEVGLPIQCVLYVKSLVSANLISIK